LFVGSEENSLLSKVISAIDNLGFTIETKCNGYWHRQRDIDVGTMLIFEKGAEKLSTKNVKSIKKKSQKKRKKARKSRTINTNKIEEKRPHNFVRLTESNDDANTLVKSYSNANLSITKPQQLEIKPKKKKLMHWMITLIIIRIIMKKMN